MDKKQELLEYFTHMEREHFKCSLGGMAWDDVNWHLHDAIKLGLNKFKLAEMFPLLFGNLIINEDNYLKRKQELEQSLIRYTNNSKLLKENNWHCKLVDDTEIARLRLADRYLDYAKNCEILLEQLENDRSDYVLYLNSKNS